MQAARLHDYTFPLSYSFPSYPHTSDLLFGSLAGLKICKDSYTSNVLLTPEGRHFRMVRHLSDPWMVLTHLTSKLNPDEVILILKMLQLFPHYLGYCIRSSTT